MSNQYLSDLKNGFRKDWNKIPNLLTQIRLIGSPVPGIILLCHPNNNASRITAVIIFLILALTDAFDGLLARCRNEETEYGRLLDPIADGAFGCLTLIAMSFIMPNVVWLTIVIIVRQLHMFWLINQSIKKGLVVSVTVLGKLKTVVVGVSTVVLLLPQSWVDDIYRNGLICLAILLSVVSWIGYFVRYLRGKRLNS